MKSEQNVRIDITVDHQYGSVTNGNEKQKNNNKNKANKKAELTNFRRTSSPTPFKNYDSAVK